MGRGPIIKPAMQGNAFFNNEVLDDAIFDVGIRDEAFFEGGIRDEANFNGGIRDKPNFIDGIRDGRYPGIPPPQGPKSLSYTASFHPFTQLVLVSHTLVVPCILGPQI